MKIKIVFLLSVLFIANACNDQSQNTPKEKKITTTELSPVFHASHEPKKQNTPFSDAVEVGNTYYLAGQIGMDHKTRELVVGGIENETRQALENIKAVLEQHGLNMEDVVKATVILDDISDFQAFNEVYVSYFPQKPARTTFAAEALARGAKIEIEVVAYRSKQLGEKPVN